MSFFTGMFINPWMLLGLTGLALPVLAHLLSKKKYDVVDWGAMQFLELRKNARRKIRLEELLLLALRMGLIALLAIALARPWVAGGLIGGFRSQKSRDVVFVIDGSYSMGWAGKAETPHAAAIQWTHEFLEELNPGDTVAILEARDVVHPVIGTPTRDFRYAREQLTALPKPAGSSNLAEAAAAGVQILSQTSNVSRELIVLTDGQALGWKSEDGSLWSRFDELRAQPTIAPRVWVVDVGRNQSGASMNFSVDQMTPSRELTVTGAPVRFQSKVFRRGGQGTTTRRVHFEVDGQRLAEKSIAVQLSADGEATVEVEHRFTSKGSHVVAFVLDDDALPGDNVSQAAVRVAEALPVLLVDGTPNSDPLRSETFFARAALSAETNETPWIAARSIDWNAFAVEELNGVEVVILANVPRLSDEQTEALRAHVAGGGGLWISLGDAIDAAAYNATFFAGDDPLLPIQLESISRDEADPVMTRVDEASLELPWIAGLTENDGGLTEARFSHWWTYSETKPVEEETLADRSAIVTGARLSSGAALVTMREYGRGSVLLMTSALDADWSTLPAKPDFVSLLHEGVFHLSSGQVERNVMVGAALVEPLGSDQKIGAFAFYSPEGKPIPPQPAGDEFRRLARLDDTYLPGEYRFRRTDERIARRRPEEESAFVVNFDRSESDLTRLSGEQQLGLMGEDRMQFVESMDDLRAAMFHDDSRAEFWYLLMLVFVGILVGEVFMTRRLVQGGHEAIDGSDDEAELSQATAVSNVQAGHDGRRS